MKMGLMCSSEMQEPFLYSSSDKEVTMNSPLVGLQNTSDIRVELGIQEGAREAGITNLAVTTWRPGSWS